MTDTNNSVVLAALTLQPLQSVGISGPMLGVSWSISHWANLYSSSVLYSLQCVVDDGDLYTLENEN